MGIAASRRRTSGSLSITRYDVVSEIVFAADVAFASHRSMSVRGGDVTDPGGLSEKVARPAWRASAMIASRGCS